MTKYGTLAAVLFLALPTSAHAFASKWLNFYKAANPTDWGTVVDLQFEGSSFVYMCGNFSGTLTVGGTVLTSVGNIDMYVAKFTKGGAPVWVKSFGTKDNDTVYSCTPSGADVVVTGSFVKPLTFGATTVTSTGGVDVFVTKLNYLGNTRWAKVGGGSGYHYPHYASVDASGNITILGVQKAAATFDGIAVPYAGGSDAFLWQLNSSGVTNWADGFGSAANDYANDLALDSAGNIYISGNMRDNFDMQGTNLSSVGDADVYLAKFSSSGVLDWARSIGSTGTEQSGPLFHDGTSLYMTVEFDAAGSIDGNPISPVGNSDLVIGSIDPATGQFLWVTDTGLVATADDIHDVTPGQLAFAGAYMGTATFGADVLPSYGSWDGYVGSVDRATGVVVAGVHCGTPTYDIVTHIAGTTSMLGRLFTAGNQTPGVGTYGAASNTAIGSDVFLGGLYKGQFLP